MPVLVGKSALFPPVYLQLFYGEERERAALRVNNAAIAGDAIIQ
jgi:hypothetical protein